MEGEKNLDCSSVVEEDCRRIRHEARRRCCWRENRGGGKKKKNGLKKSVQVTQTRVGETGDLGKR